MFRIPRWLIIITALLGACVIYVGIPCVYSLGHALQILYAHGSYITYFICTLGSGDFFIICDTTFILDGSNINIYETFFLPDGSRYFVALRLTTGLCCAIFGVFLGIAVFLGLRMRHHTASADALRWFFLRMLLYLLAFSFVFYIL